MSTAPALRARAANEPPADWRDDAACRDRDPDLFFPIGTEGPAAAQEAAAKAVCSGCAVRPQCLEFALRTAQQAGIWGGLGEGERFAERRRFLRQRRRAAA